MRCACVACQEQRHTAAKSVHVLYRCLARVRAADERDKGYRVSAVRMSANKQNKMQLKTNDESKPVAQPPTATTAAHALLVQLSARGRADEQQECAHFSVLEAANTTVNNDNENDSENGQHTKSTP